MNQERCTEVEQQLWRYIDRELSAGDLAAISAHLRDCERCRGLYHEWSMEANQYRQSFLESRFGERFVRRCMARISEEGLIGREPAPRGALGGRMLRLVFLAAMLLVLPAAIAVVVISTRPQPLGRFEAKGLAVLQGQAKGDGSCEYSSQEATRGACFAGSAFKVPLDSVLRVFLDLPSGERSSVLEVTGPATFTVSLASRKWDFHATLASGILHASVGRLATGHSFGLQTPEALVSILGTEFQLEVGEEGTTLKVMEGNVAFEAKAGEVPVPAGARQLSVRPSSGTWIVRRGQSRPEPLVAWSALQDVGTGEGLREDSSLPRVGEDARGQAGESATAEVPSAQPAGAMDLPESKEDLDTPRGKESHDQED